MEDADDTLDGVSQLPVLRLAQLGAVFLQEAQGSLGICKRRPDTPVTPAHQVGGPGMHAPGPPPASAHGTAPAQPGSFFVRSWESAGGTVPLAPPAGSRQPPLLARPAAAAAVSQRRRQRPGPLGVRRSPCFLTGMALRGRGAPPAAGAPPRKL